jgi:hypothetical protein
MLTVLGKAPQGETHIKGRKSLVSMFMDTVSGVLALSCLRLPVPG